MQMPKGADESWAQKLYNTLSTRGQFEKPRTSNIEFVVRHYAGDVSYHCNGFVRKNKDLINEEHLETLRSSEVIYLIKTLKGRIINSLNDGRHFRWITKNIATQIILTSFGS